MSIRQDLLTAAAKSKDVLQESTGLIVDFLKKQLNDDGGFKGRSSHSDLYYTVFGLESLITLDVEFECTKISDYLSTFTDLDSLDFISLACLIRCKADISDFSFSYELTARLNDFRSADGGFNNQSNAETGTAYGCFLALGAYQDMQSEIPNPQGLVECLNSLKTHEGGFSNDKTICAGSVPATAAALSVLYYLGEMIEEKTLTWLMRQFSQEGGFLAAPAAPIPDLLSTATALHTLGLMNISLDNFRERCLDYVDTLWNGKGAFCGSAADNTCDCEYTFYGLLSLGNLNK